MMYNVIDAKEKQADAKRHLFFLHLLTSKPLAKQAAKRDGAGLRVYIYVAKRNSVGLRVYIYAVKRDSAGLRVYMHVYKG